MRKRISLFLLGFCLLLTACAPAAQPEPEPDPAPAVEASAPEEIPAPEEDPEPELSERDRNWITDIHYLQTHYKKYHPDPFYYCPEEEFDRKIDQLCQKVSDLSDNDIFFEMSAIIAGMGDIHTWVSPPDSLSDYLFPFNASYYDGRLYLYSYLEGYEQFEPYLLREIVAVNGVDISYLERKAESVSSPNNTWNSRSKFWGYFAPAFFDWAGCGYQDGYTFQILDENQKVQSVEAPLVPLAEYNATPAVYPESWAYLLTAEGGNHAEYCEGENGGYVYMALEDIHSSLLESRYRQLFEKAAELLETHPDCRKLVIDLRDNPGGYVLAIDYLREDIQILKALSNYQTYVLIGGYSMSGAIECIGLFKEALNAVTVGEPTGQFTSFFAYTSPALKITLPLSQITVSVSSGWYEGNNFAGVAYDEDGRLHEWENTVLPDVYVYQDIEDIRQGKSSALKWVLAQ